METTDRDSAAEQLNLIAQARSAGAERFATPIWYHPVLALALAAHLVAFTLGGGLVRLVATLGMLAVVLALASLALHDAVDLAWPPYVLAVVVAVAVLVLGPRADAAAQ